MGVLIAVYIASCLAWGLAYWLGLRDGHARVGRRAAWARALGMLLLLVIGFGVRNFPAILVSASVLPCCYLLGWKRTSRSGLAAKAKAV